MNSIHCDRAPRIAQDHRLEKHAAGQCAVMDSPAGKTGWPRRGNEPCEEVRGLRKTVGRNFAPLKSNLVVIKRCLELVLPSIRSVFGSPDRASAERRFKEIVTRYATRAPKPAAWMEENLPQGLTVLSLPQAHQKSLRTTNGLERVNQELKRRTRVARMFSDKASLLRLVSALLLRSATNGKVKNPPHHETANPAFSLDAQTYFRIGPNRRIRAVRKNLTWKIRASASARAATLISSGHFSRRFARFSATRPIRSDNLKSR